MRIRYQQLLGLFEHRHSLLPGNRWKVVEELSQRMATFEVIDQVFKGHPRSHEDRGPAKNLWIRVNSVSHAPPFYSLPQRLTVYASAA